MNLIQKLKNLDNKNKIIIRNTLGAFIIKGAALVVSLLTTPAFIRYFNNNVVLGVWYTLLSVLIWFLNFDLGIGNGIRNNLVKALSENDRKEAKSIISSGLASISVVTLALTLVGILLISLLDLNWLFNISVSDISYNVLLWSTLYIFIAVMLRFALTVISSIFYALQKSAINNFLSLCVSVLQLVFVLIVHFDSAEQALLVLSLSYLVISNLPVLIAGIIIFLTTLKDCKPNFKFIDKAHCKQILSIGGVFFFCQILYMIIINTNEFIITQFFGPQFTTEYTFYYKLSSLISMLITLALTPIWSIVTKAMVEKNFIWLNKLYKIIKIVGIGVIVLQFALVPILQPIMDVWLGVDSIPVNYVTAIAFACFGSVFVYSSMLSTIVCGLARMKLQLICYSVGVVVKFLLIFLLASVVNDWSIVVWSNAIILLPYCVLQHIELDLYMKKQIKIFNEKGEDLNESVHE